jgi:hypothetical protein
MEAKEEEEMKMVISLSFFCDEVLDPFVIFFTVLSGV